MESSGQLIWDTSVYSLELPTQLIKKAVYKLELSGQLIWDTIRRESTGEERPQIFSRQKCKARTVVGRGEEPAM